MNFNELKAIMIKNGISSLSEIARQLDTTPQAVSNWKSRNQIPHHIVDRITNSDESQNESYQLKSTLTSNKKRKRVGRGAGPYGNSNGLKHDRNKTSMSRMPFGPATLQN